MTALSQEEILSNTKTVVQVRLAISQSAWYVGEADDTGTRLLTDNLLLSGSGHVEEWAPPDSELAAVFYEDDQEREWRHEPGRGEDVHPQEGARDDRSWHRGSTGAITVQEKVTFCHWQLLSSQQIQRKKLYLGVSVFHLHLAGFSPQLSVPQDLVGCCECPEQLRFPWQQIRNAESQTRTDPSRRNHLRVQHYVMSVSSSVPWVLCRLSIVAAKPWTGALQKVDSRKTSREKILVWLVAQKVYLVSQCFTISSGEKNCSVKYVWAIPVWAWLLCQLLCSEYCFAVKGRQIYQRTTLCTERGVMNRLFASCIEEIERSCSRSWGTKSHQSLTFSFSPKQQKAAAYHPYRSCRKDAGVVRCRHVEEFRLN